MPTPTHRYGRLLLATPLDTALETLERFIQDNQTWIYTKLEEKLDRERLLSPKEYVTGDGFCCFGHSYRLKLVSIPDRQPPLRLYPSRFELRRDTIHEARNHFIRWYAEHLRPALDPHL